MSEYDTSRIEKALGMMSVMDVLEAHPTLIDVLKQASSQNTEEFKPAELKLKEWETQTGFYLCLTKITSTYTLDNNIRLMAALCVKNGVDKYWRKQAQNAICEDEKQQIRQYLLSAFDEPIKEISTQKAVILSKVARFDYPKEWPELISTLIAAIESADSITQSRALFNMQSVITALASKRLAGDKRLFQELTSSIYNFMLHGWNVFTESLIKDVSTSNDNTVILNDLEKNQLIVRMLRKLTVYGFYKPHYNRACLDFLNKIFDRTKYILELRLQQKSDELIVNACEKYIHHLVKTLKLTLDYHPLSYVEFVLPTLKFTTYYAFTKAGNEFMYEKIVIHCFNIIKAILLCAEYKPSNYSHESIQAQHVIHDFFQPDILTEMCRCLISKYFILTPSELTAWEADPETFSADNIGDIWKYSLRPSMETVFVTVFHEYRNVLAPIVLEFLKETHIIVDPEDTPGMLRKDAVYNAVQLAAYELYDEVDFDQWFSNILIQELRIKHYNYKIIRRRVCSLVGKWIGIKLSLALRPTLYECITELLQSNEDMVVRLAAASALRCAIDDFEFNSEQFKTYLDVSFQLLFKLLQDAVECETKMTVLNVMTVLVERVGHSIEPHSDALIQYLPMLWTESEDHDMLRSAIVAAVVQVIKALGTVVPELYVFVVPVIALGTDTTKDAIVYLLEDCLELWLTVLEYSTVMNQDLLILFNNMPALLEHSSENLRLYLHIILGHMLLDPDLGLKTHGVTIISICNNLMADMRNEGVMMVLRLVDSFIRVRPLIGLEVTLPILSRIMMKVYEGETYPMIMSMHLTIVSRIILISLDFFSNLIIDLGVKLNKNHEQILPGILDVWLAKMPNVTQLEQKKLTGLALSSLLSTGNVHILERFPSVIAQICETLNDVTKTDEMGVLSDCLILAEGQSPNYYNQDYDGFMETDHDQRIKELVLNDPVHTIVLQEYLQAQLMTLRIGLEPSRYQMLFDSLSNEVKEQLSIYITQ